MRPRDTAAIASRYGNGAWTPIASFAHAHHAEIAMRALADEQRAFDATHLPKAKMRFEYAVFPALDFRGALDYRPAFDEPEWMRVCGGGVE